MISDDDTYNSDNETNEQIPADNSCSVEQKQGSFFEQLPGPNKPVKCSSTSKFEDYYGSNPR